MTYTEAKYEDVYEKIIHTYREFIPMFGEFFDIVIIENQKVGIRPTIQEPTNFDVNKREEEKDV